MPPTKCQYDAQISGESVLPGLKLRRTASPKTYKSASMPTIKWAA